ncbi:MAG TPA: tRNA pseudouridine(55) synthase TruB [Usitatibacter sp.]|nr:tRNA pseudouridine(55) synthase TruB [Usitatibacter sp.]
MAPGVDACEGVLLLDKPAGFSSTQALARAKRLLGARKGGHTGTLDPFATGLLPLVFGEATKFSRFLIDSRKSYDAVLELGLETTSGDPEGEVTARGEVLVSAQRIDEVLASFVGHQRQTPPMHSALHVNGRRLYEYARAGEEVERTPRDIEIHSIRRLALEGARLSVAVECSKGTYIRALATDIGRALGCGASLSALRRTSVGPFRLEGATSLEAIEENPGRACEDLMPPEALVRGIARLDASALEAKRFGHGQAIAAGGGREGEEVAVFDPDGRFVGVGIVRSGALLAPLRLMARTAPDAPDLLEQVAENRLK